MELSRFEDDTHGDNDEGSLPQSFDKRTKSELLKVHFDESQGAHDADVGAKNVETLSKDHKSSSEANAELNGSIHHDQEHTTIPAVVAASTTATANRAPVMPDPLAPTTRVVKRPPSLRARRPGAYSIDGMDAASIESNRDDFEEYDFSVSPSIEASREVSNSSAAANPNHNVSNRSLLFIAGDGKGLSCMSRKVALIILAVLVVIGIAVGVGVGVSDKGKSSSSASSSTSISSPSNCHFTGQEQPSFFQQCNCSGSVNIVSSAVSQSYQSLLTSLVPLVIPDFQDAVNSCSAANQALLWLANDTITTTTTTGFNSTRWINRLVLVLLYITWGGSGWQQNEGWASSSNECNWFGITCQQEQVITQISLCNNSASGGIPTELFELTGLVSLALAGNALNGTFPSSISKLTRLEYLDVANNALVGSFPFSAFTSLTDLVGIDFSLNTFSGTLPSTIGQLTKLQSLSGSSNNIGGTIPTEVALATKLAVLELVNNLFTGYIPSQVGRLTNLEWASFGGPLVGIVPTEFGLLSKLRALIITTQMSMEGHIPTQLGLLSQLRTLALPGNLLTGSIPSSLGHCSRLAFLILDGNELAGTIPTELGMISTLEMFDASQNFLQGSIPSSLFHSSLQLLNLAGNRLTGSLPVEIRNASQLECIDLTKNLFDSLSSTSICQEVGPTLQHAAVDCSAQQHPPPSINNTGCPCCNCQYSCLRMERSGLVLERGDSCLAVNTTFASSLSL